MAVPAEPADLPETDSVGHPRRPEHATPNPPPPDRVGRFTVGKVCNHGGLGEILEAEDVELHRPVALKRIHPARAADPDYRRRFLVEAEITAKLEHPGIVPVYGLLPGGDGQPYYAMRLIQGEPLSERLARFHAGLQGAWPAAGRREADTGLDFRRLLQHFIAVCQTVAYAHDRGVIHRDLKPANIMLGKFGETLVIDWGLAKVVGRSGPEPAAEEGTLHLSQAVPLDTIPGQAMGTPGYMSPEQARGEWHRTGPPSDVYSLGATLYHLLTGRPPDRWQKGEALADLVRRVCAGDYPAPREVRPEVPRPPEAICRRAMALAPEHRYPGALALAADVERWLADEPVTAHAESVAERQARGLRWFHQAQHELWASHFELGEVYWQMGDGQAARDAHQKGLATIEPLLGGAAAAHQGQLRLDLSLSLERLGDVSRQMGETERAKGFYLQVRQVREELDRQSPNDPQTRRHLATAYSKLGDVSKALGDAAEAKGYYYQALRIDRELSEQGRQDALAQRDHAVALTKVGDVSRQLGDAAQALECYSQALAIRRRLAEASIFDTQAQRDLAAAFMKLGDVYLRMGELPRAREHYNQGLAIRNKLALDDPEDAHLARDVTFSLTKLGDVALRAGDLAQARACYEDGLRQRQQLASRNLADVHLQRDLAASNDRLGDLSLQERDPARAREYYEVAFAINQALANRDDRDALSRRDLAVAHAKRGDAQVWLGQPAAALTHYRAALAVAETRYEEDPNDTQVKRDLAAANERLGDAALHLADLAQARTHYRHAQRLRAERAKADGRDAQAQTDLVVICAKLAAVAKLEHDYADALKWLTRGHELLARQEEGGKLAGQPQYAAWLADFARQVAYCTLAAKAGQDGADGPAAALLLRAGLRARGGWDADLAALAADLAGLDGAAGAHLFHAACGAAICAPGGRARPATLRDTPDLDAAARWAAQALAAAGGDRADLARRLREDARLAALRAHPAVEPLL